MNVKAEHLIKFLKSKMKKSVYGSALIHIRDGEVSGVTWKDDYNSDAFVHHVEQLEKKVNRYVVKNKVNISDDDSSDLPKTAEKLSKTDEVDEQIVEIDTINEQVDTIEK